MGRRRFGRRTPGSVQVSRKEADFLEISGRTLFSKTEGDGHIWAFQESWESKDGAFRLISIENLLSSVGTPAIDLIEWSGIRTWPRDNVSRHGVKLPGHWPKYAAISHVWKPSDDAVRLADEAKRPLQIHVGKQEPHQISWLGLVQAAVAAHVRGCQYIWLDLLCLDQQSPKDKKIQIQNMAKIYQNATTVIVMPGGVVAAQNLDQPSSWINRAWTLQEATLGWPRYVLVNWTLPGSFSYFSKLNHPGGNISVGLAPLEPLVRHGPTKSLGVSMLAAQDGTGTRQYESELTLLCLGDEPAVLSTFSSIIEDSTVRAPKPKSSDSDSSASSLKREFSESDLPPNPSTLSSVVDDSTVHVPQFAPAHADASPWSSDWESYESDDSETSFKLAAPPGHSVTQPEESAPITSSSGQRKSKPTPAWRANILGPLSDDSEEEWGDDSSEGSNRRNPELEIRYSAVWRSMWLRTSTKEQDMVYSMMHLLDAELDVDYSRSLNELVFDLVVRTWSMPAWLTIGYNIPVRPESGLIPAFPTFTPNSNPTYDIDGKVVSAGDLICNDEFFCQKFDIKFMKSSPTEGHAICAIILDVKVTSRRDGDESGSNSLSFHEVELTFAGPGQHAVQSVCTLKGRVGEVAVVIGDYKTLADMDRYGKSESLFIFFLGSKSGTWQKTGAGWLCEPLLSPGVITRLQRRHMKVGVGSANEKPVECDCPKALQTDDCMGGEADADQLAAHLAQAVLREDQSGIERLLDLGADVNRQAKYFGTPLLSACFNGNVQIVKTLLARGADANNPSEISSLDLSPAGLWYGTPLQVACILDFEPVARQLIEQGGVDVNAMVGQDGSALHAALKLPYGKRVVPLLLAHKADVNAVGGMYGTCLMAAQAQNPPLLELVRQLVSYGADINSTKGIFVTQDGWLCRSALQMSCRNNSVEMVRALITMGADVNLCSGGSFATAMQEAVYYGYSLVCEILLESGADVNIQGGIFGNALQAAVAGFAAGFCDRRPEICEYVLRLLLKNGADVNAKGGYYGDALSAAELIGDSSTTRVLREHGASRDATVTNEPDTNLQPRDDWTELHLASNLGRLEAVEVLLVNGYEASRPDGDGRTPLHLASCNGHVEVVQELLRHRAYVNGTDKHDCTALHLASEAGYTAVARVLLEHGADPTLVNKKGQSAVMIAVVRDHSAITVLLLDHVSNLSRVALTKVFFELVWNGYYSAVQVLANRYRIDCIQIDFQGRTTAHMAAQSGHVDLLDYLLRRQVNPLAVDLQQTGLLHFAARSRSAVMVDKVLPFFAPPPAGHNNWSPLHWACRVGDVSVVEGLLKSGHSESIVITTEPPGQWTPGAIAAFHNNQDVVSLLAAHRAQAANQENHDRTIPFVQTPAPKDGEFYCHGCRLVRV